MPRIISAAPIWAQNIKELQSTACFNYVSWIVQERFVEGKGQQKIQIPTGLLIILSNHTVLCWNGNWSDLNLCILNGYSGYGQWLVAYLWTAKMHHASLKWFCQWSSTMWLQDLAGSSGGVPFPSVSSCLRMLRSAFANVKLYLSGHANEGEM